MALVVRVIGGTLGGRRLLAVPGTETRPTTDRVREALFSRLESRYGLTGARVLDLFAGTGAVGLEALSRGANGVVAAEISPVAADVVRRNCEMLGMTGSLELYQGTATRLLERLTAGTDRFDGAFLDPPYGGGLLPDTLASLVNSGVMRRGSWVVIESAKGGRVEIPDGLLVVREDRYGDSLLTLLEIDPGTEPENDPATGSGTGPKTESKVGNEPDAAADHKADQQADQKNNGAGIAPE